MLNIFLKIFSVLENVGVGKLLSKASSLINKTPTDKIKKKLSKGAPRWLTKGLFISRLGVSEAVQFQMEKRYAKSLFKRIEKLADESKITSRSKSKIIKDPTFLKRVREQNLLTRYYLYFTQDYRNYKLLKGRDDALFGNRYNKGFITNSNWLKRYTRGNPYATLSTKNKSFKVIGLTDNMLDRMLVAPDAGKFLWDTLWISRRGRRPDEVIKSRFSGAFRKEYAKRKQAFKK